MYCRYIDNHSAAVLPFYTSLRCFGTLCYSVTILITAIITVVVVYSINDNSTAGMLSFLFYSKGTLHCKNALSLETNLNTIMFIFTYIGTKYNIHLVDLIELLKFS